MRVVIEAVKAILREDAALPGIVGLDSTSTPKIYEPDVPQSVEAPYIVVQIIPGARPQGTYGDDYAIMNFSFQTTCWGRNKGESWLLWDTVFEVFDITPETFWNALLTPWELMTITHPGDARQLPDRETALYQVHGTYDLAITRR